MKKVWKQKLDELDAIILNTPVDDPYCLQELYRKREALERVLVKELCESRTKPLSVKKLIPTVNHEIFEQQIGRSLRPRKIDYIVVDEIMNFDWLRILTCLFHRRKSDVEGD